MKNTTIPYSIEYRTVFLEDGSEQKEIKIPGIAPDSIKVSALNDHTPRYTCVNLSILEGEKVVREFMLYFNLYVTDLSKITSSYKYGILTITAPAEIPNKHKIKVDIA